MPKNSNKDKVGNYSFDFDGTSDWIDIAPFDMLGGGSAMSLSLWIKAGVQADSYAGPLFNDNANYGFYQDNLANRLIFRVETSVGVVNLTSDTGFFTDTWTHIVGTYDGSDMNFYVNGSLHKTGAQTGTIDATSGSMLIGNVQGISYFDGLISEVCVFDYDLTLGNVTTLYGDATNGVGNPMGLDAVPVGYWKGDKAGLGDQWAVPNQVSKDYVFNFESGDYVGYAGFPLALGGDYGIESSFSFWCKTTEAGTFGLFNLGGGNNRIYIYPSTGWRNNQVHFHVGGGAQYVVFNASSSVRDGNWHHWCLTIPTAAAPDGYTMIGMELYIDGSPIGQDTTAGAIGGTGWDELDFGRAGSPAMGATYYYIGDGSNFQIFDTELSQANVTSLYNNGTPLSSMPSGTLTDNLKGWWKLDDSATFSTNWSIPDDSTNSNTFTSASMTQGNLIPDTVTRGTAMYSEYSFEFDGVGDYFDCGTSIGTSLGDGYTGPLAVSIWFKADITSGDDGLFIFGSSYGELSVGLKANNLDVRVSNVLELQHAFTDTTDWHNLVVNLDGSATTTNQVYLDGVAIGSTFGTYTALDLDALNFFIAQYWSASYPFQGKMSNTAIWNTALSAANVLTIYNNGRPGNLTSLSPIAWWKMGEDAFATVAAPTAWTIPDQIGSNNGTSAGNPDLVGEAPQSFANGLSVSMDIYDRIGESGFSDSNALSYNMPEDTRKAY